MDELKYDTLGQKVTYWILFPGEWVCDYFKVEGHNERAIIRMFVNLSVYAKIAGSTALAYVMYF